jgi:XTP/dITP diphosphohydrolase
MRFIYGTGNAGKIAQVKEFFKTRQNIELDIISLKDIGFDEDIVEDGDTFEANSLIKANAIKAFCDKKNINEIIVADDAGLCVDALGGRPGVLSARYAGDHAPQEVAVNKLLNEMKDVPVEKRTAQFVCVLTAILKDGQKLVVRGETKGSIVVTPGKMAKLTYDPVFMPNEFGRPMSEISSEELGVTYRQKAFLELLKKIGRLKNK